MNRRLISWFALALALALALPALPFAAHAAEPNANETAYARVIVRFKPGSATTLGVAATHAKRVRPESDEYAVALGKDPAAQLAALKADPRVEWAEPDYVMQTTYTSTPNDPYFTESTAYNLGFATLSHARSWWERGYGSVNANTVWPYLAAYPPQQYGARATADSVPVAVIDTGFYMDHPDRGANIVVGKDCFATYSSATNSFTTDYDVTPDDPSAPGNSVYIASHGTCVAGEIAAATDNGVGNSGVGFDALVRIYKVQGIWIEGDSSQGIAPGTSLILTTALANAIYQATDDGCKVINMSLGQSKSSTSLQDAVDYAHLHGVVVVGATGNDGKPGVLYPAACNYAVGAGSYYIKSNSTSDPGYERSKFTNYGTGLDVLAPGAEIWGFIKPDFDDDGAASSLCLPGYYWWNGTSMASPVVAGGIAALWRFAPWLTNDEIAQYALRSAHDLGTVGYDTGYGWGAFDMQAARQAIIADYPELVGPTITVRPGAVTNATAGTVEWAPVAGYNVTYDFTLDGVTSSTAGTSQTLSSLAQGTHEVRITSKSERNWWSVADSSTSFSFVVDTTAPAPYTPMPVWRFYRLSTGTHFYTADPVEMARVRDTMSSVYSLDGVSYYINTSNSANSVPLYRFYNARTGTHLYTADVDEKNNILANLSGIYSLDGVAYSVSMTSGLAVHRFYNPAKGVHFYSADPAEIEWVRTNLGAIWHYEGPAYYVGQ